MKTLKNKAIQFKRRFKITSRMFEGQIYKESIICQDPKQKRFKQKKPSK